LDTAYFAAAARLRVIRTMSAALLRSAGAHLLYV
jgi:hypothetical protein